MRLQPIPLADFRRLWYPVTPVIIAVEYQGQQGGMPAVSCMPLSGHPPLLGIAVTPTLHTYGLLQNAKTFTINWVNYEHAAKIAYLGTTSGRAVPNKLTAAGFTTARAPQTGAPMLQEAVATVECGLKDTVPTGDHNLLIAEAVAGYASPDFHDYWQFHTYEPALYVGGGARVPQKRWFRGMRKR